MATETVTAQSAAHPGAGAPAPTFSIVVPVRNEAGYVEETLHSLLAQEYPQEQVEILVVDGGSTDASREIVSRLMQDHPNVRLLDNPRVLPAAGRNTGIRAARGQFVGIVDGHSFVRPDFLRTAQRLFEEKGVDCLGRPVELFIPSDSYLQRVIGAARTSWLGHNPVSPRYSSARGATSPLSVGILYRREVFDRIGCFNEQLDACEDVELNSRLEQAGMRAWTDPALRAYYHPRGSLWALFRQMKRYASGRYRLLRAQRRGFHMSQAVPAAALAVGLALLGAGALRLVPWALPAAGAVAYLALIAVASVRASLTRGLRYLPLLPVVFAVIHCGAAVGLWASLLDDVRSRLCRRGPLENGGQSSET